MSGTAAHLVDRVMPEVGVRQWVLSLPVSLRLRISRDPDLIGEVLAVYLDQVFLYLRLKMGVDDDMEARAGAVTWPQFFGGALNRNLHFHSAVPDGLWMREPSSGRIKFYPLMEDPAEEEVARLTTGIAAGVLRLLERRGIVRDGEYQWPDPSDEECPAFARVVGASGQGRVAFGYRAGQRVVRHIDESAITGEGRERRGDAFDLHIGALIEGEHRDRLENLFRYAARPPVSEKHLSMTESGNVLFELRRPWSDGTTHMEFGPLEFMERLAAIIPPPGMHLVRYHGVFAPGSAWREEIVPSPPPITCPMPPMPERSSSSSRKKKEGEDRSGKRYWIRWCDLLLRVFQIDPLVCPSCGSRMRILATLHESPAVGRILECLGLPEEAPEVAPARLLEYDDLN